MKEEERNRIAEKIRSLEQVPPETTFSREDVWASIHPEPEQRGTAWYRMAAAVALLFASTLAALYAWQSGKEEFRISYSTEQYYPATPPPDGYLAESEESALIFLDEKCRNLLAICKDPEFMSLREELNQLEQEKKALEKMIEQYGQDPVFEQSRIQIENLQGELTNQLIQMVLS